MNRPSVRALACLVVASVLCPAFAVAQSTGGAGPRPIVGAPAPPAPVAPQVASGNAESGVTVRAVRLTEPLTLDGRLDEPIYRTVPPAGDFIQTEPNEGEPATEKTDGWIFFDNKNLYVSVRCWDSHPEREVANELRRDNSNVLQSESVTITLDTFHDKRNSVHLAVNSLGGVMDGLSTDEGAYNGDWNTVWEVKTAKFADGWTLEWTIPFKSLRYAAGPNQVWGVNVRRVVKWKNELSYLAPIPAFLGMGGILNMSLAATLVGLEVPSAGKNLEIKPYVITGLRSDRTARPPTSNDLDKSAGFDVKYGVSSSLTADFTYNTDFAQVEDDQQQVNLTRFSLFFPEKREFFLEGRGIFNFGGVGNSPIRSVGPDSSPDNTPVLFFSRRIGLNNGQAVPIDLGGRMTGRVGSYSVGLLNIQTNDDVLSGTEATNFTVVRLKRDFLKRSNFGMVYTGRSVAASGQGASQTFGVDAKYGFSPSLNVTTYLAGTNAPGATRNATSYLGRLDYNTDRYGIQVERLGVGPNFNPDVGFMRRADFTRNYAQLRFSPRPRSRRLQAVRKFTYSGSFASYTNRAGRLDMRETQGEMGIEFQNSDRANVEYQRDFEFIPQPFLIAPKVTVPVGGYTNESVKAAYQLGGRRRISGWLIYEGGSLYDGTKQRLEYKSGRIVLMSRLQVEPSVSLNWVRMPWGDFVAKVVSTRTTFGLSPRLFVGALLQYNSNSYALTSNVRLRWEYRPGSELFVVYNEGRDTLRPGFPSLQSRALVVKTNWLARF